MSRMHRWVIGFVVAFVGFGVVVEVQGQTGDGVFR